MGFSVAATGNRVTFFQPAGPPPGVRRVVKVHRLAATGKSLQLRENVRLLGQPMGRQTGRGRPPAPSRGSRESGEAVMSRIECEQILREAGLDIFSWFRPTRVLSELTARENEERAIASLPDLGSSGWGLLVGNTKALWPHFLRAYEQGQGLEHPLDHYVERAVQTAAKRLGSRHWTAFSHTVVPRPFPIQRLADEIGFAQLGPAHLSVHPTYGPWIALRAIIVCELEEHDWPPEAANLRKPCDGCAAPCTQALQNALIPSKTAAPEAKPHIPPRQLSPDGARWLAVREACPWGSEHRYGDDQIVYHYDKNDRVLSIERSRNSDRF